VFDRSATAHDAPGPLSRSRSRPREAGAVSDSGSGLRLSWDREEELLAELVAVAWELSRKHDGRRHPGGFAKGCYRLLCLRTVDWIRRTEGRTRWSFSLEGAQRSRRRRVVETDGVAVVDHPRPQVLSLDVPVGSDSDASLGETVAALEVDGPGSWPAS
jgi:hypothetical protein